MKIKLEKMIQPIMALIATLTLCLVMAAFFVNEINTQEYTLIVDLKDDADPFETIPSLLKEEKVTKISTIDAKKNQYRVSIHSKKEKKNILKWLLGIDTVEDAK